LEWDVIVLGGWGENCRSYTQSKKLGFSRLIPVSQIKGVTALLVTPEARLSLLRYIHDRDCLGRDFSEILWAAVQKEKKIDRIFSLYPKMYQNNPDTISDSKDFSKLAPCEQSKSVHGGLTSAESKFSKLEPESRESRSEYVGSVIEGEPLFSTAESTASKTDSKSASASRTESATQVCHRDNKKSKSVDHCVKKKIHEDDSATDDEASFKGGEEEMHWTSRKTLSASSSVSTDSDYDHLGCPTKRKNDGWWAVVLLIILLIIILIGWGLYRGNQGAY